MRFLLLLLLALPLPAAADRGALTVDAGGGLSAPFVKAPYAPGSSALSASSPSVWVGGRYALSNHLEVSAAGFWEPPVTLWHNNVRVRAGGTELPGTLTHQASRAGALVGGRFVYGMVWRLTAGLDVGWSWRRYTGLQAIDDTNPAAPVDYGVQLADVNTHNLVLSPVVGLEWAAGDHWSVAVTPRAQLLLGADPAVAFTVPVTLSWSWYL